MNGNYYKYMIESRYGKVVVQAGDEYKVLCKKCGHRALWINPEMKVYKCWSCGDGGHLRDLIPELCDNEFDKYRVRGKKKVSASSGVPTNGVLPASYFRVENRAIFPEGWDYLIKRGINPAAVEFGTHDRTSVLFPVREDDKVVYWQSRSIYPYVAIKTDNPPKSRLGGKGKEDYVFGFDKFQEGSLAVVVEGIFDALHTSGLSTFGKTISDVQIQKILSKKPSIILVSYDADAHENVHKAVSKFHAAGFRKAFPIKLESGDPADLGYDKFFITVEKQLRACSVRSLLQLLGAPLQLTLKLLQQTRSNAQQYAMPLS